MFLQMVSKDRIIGPNLSHLVIEKRHSKKQRLIIAVFAVSLRDTARYYDVNLK